MGLVRWRLGHLAAGRTWRRLLWGYLAVCGLAVAWPAGTSYGEAGPSNAFGIWSVIQWMAAFVVGALGAGSPEGQDTGEAGAGEETAILSWSDWVRFGGLRPGEAVAGYVLAGTLAGAAAAAGALPWAAFAAGASGMPGLAVGAWAAVAIMAPAAAASTSVAIGMAVPDALRVPAWVAVAAAVTSAVPAAFRLLSSWEAMDGLAAMLPAARLVTLLGLLAAGASAVAWGVACRRTRIMGEGTARGHTPDASR